MVWRPLNFEYALRFLYWFYTIKGTKRYIKAFLVCFLKKDLIWGNLIFSGHFLMFDWVWSKLSQATVTIGSLKSQDMIKILKQSGHYFSVIGEIMISKKLKIFCSLTESRLEFILEPLQTNYSQIFINCHVWNRGLQN